MICFHTKNKRIRINSENIDIQTQAFVDGHQLYVMLNNINDPTQTVDLALLDSEGLQRVDIKQLKIPVDQVPELTTTSVQQAPKTISLEYGETAVLTYHFDTPITFSNKIVSKKYYSKDFLKEIVYRKDNTFTFEHIETGEGLATLRLGVGRLHGLSLSPSITINGTSIRLPRDIIRGNKQENRTQFFGVLEIPFDISLLHDGSNEITVRFSDQGGQISSAILQIQKADKPLSNAASLERAKQTRPFAIYPNPAKAGEQISLSPNNYLSEFTLSTLSGKEIIKGRGNTFDTKHIEPGIYILALKNDEKHRCTKLIIN